MNAPSLLRIIGGATLVVGSFAVGKALSRGAQKLAVSKNQALMIDSAIDKQEAELNAKRKIREDLLKD